MKFVALLRGINIGGRNIIPKEALRRAFIDLGFQNVRTYIQTGNILFRSGETSAKRLTARIEKTLSARFSYAARAVVLSSHQYHAAVASAPDNWGGDNTHKHHALFLLGDATPTKVLAALPSPPPRSRRRPGIETITPGNKIIFWSMFKEKMARTSYMKLAGLPVYQDVTVRNHNTVFTVLRLFDEI